MHFSGRIELWFGIEASLGVEFLPPGTILITRTVYFKRLLRMMGQRVKKYSEKVQPKSIKVTSFCLAITKITFSSHHDIVPLLLSFFCDSFGGRQGAGTKCKSLLLRWESPLGYIKDTVRGVKSTKNASRIGSTFIFKIIRLARISGKINPYEILRQENIIDYGTWFAF